MTTVIPPTIDVHLSGDDLRQSMERDVRNGLTRRPEVPAPRLLLRRPGQPAVRRDHPAPRVLPDPRPSARSSTPTPGTSPGRRAPTPWSSSAPAPATSRGCSSTPCSRPACSNASCRSMSATPPCGRRPTALSEEYPGVAVSAVVGDFHQHLDRLPHDGTRLFAFLGGTIGNLDPGQRRQFLIQLGKVMVHRRPAAPRHRPGQGPDPAGQRLRRRRRGDRRVQPQRAARAQPRAGRRLRARPVRARGPLERGRPAHRDVAALHRRPADPGGRPRPRADLRSPARRCSPRSAPSSRPTPSTWSSASAGSSSRACGARRATSSCSPWPGPRPDGRRRRPRRRRWPARPQLPSRSLTAVSTARWKVG